MRDQDDGFLQQDDVLNHPDVLDVAAEKAKHLPAHIYAHTAPTPDMPEFINLSEVEGGKVRVGVRGPQKPAGDGREHPTYGDQAHCDLTREEAENLMVALSAWLDATEPGRPA